MRNFVLALALLLPVSAQSSRETTRQLQPAAVVDLNAQLPETLRDTVRFQELRVDGTTLYALLGSTHNPYRAVVASINFQGRLERLQEVKEPVAYSWLDVQDGQIYLLRERPGGEQVYKLQPDGPVSLWAQLPGFFHELRVIKNGSTGNSIKAFRSSGDLATFNDSGAITKEARLTPESTTKTEHFTGCALGDRYLAVDASTAKLYREEASPTLQPIGSISLPPLSPYPDTPYSRRVLIGPVQCLNHELHALVVSFRPKEGAPLVRINDGGETLSTHYLQLPTKPEYRTSGNPEGHVRPSGMAITQSRVFLLTGRGELVIYDR
jgi:hypothetical protein